MGRRPRYRGTPIHGVIAIDKPVGVGSTEVVRRVRYAAGDVKTGHAGTLDPLASGVLVCCLGRATKAVERLMGAGKEYRATIDLTGFTRTDDAEAAVEPVPVATPPDRPAIETVLAAHVGAIAQTPPAYSALKVDGRPAYARARAGEAVTLPARTVRIDAITCDAYAWPYLEITVRCGRGTYLRSLARAIGVALGTGGFLRGLRRTAVGEHRVADATPLDALPTPLTQAHLRPVGER